MGGRVIVEGVVYQQNLEYPFPVWEPVSPPSDVNIFLDQFQSRSIISSESSSQTAQTNGSIIQPSTGGSIL